MKTGSLKLGPAAATNFDVQKAAAEIDTVLAERPSKQFGIKFGFEIYRALAKAEKIKKETFSVSGTGAFPMELPAYDGRYAVCDWELGDYEVEFGTPAP